MISKYVIVHMVFLQFGKFYIPPQRLIKTIYTENNFLHEWLQKPTSVNENLL